MPNHAKPCESRLPCTSVTVQFPAQSTGEYLLKGRFLAGPPHTVVRTKIFVCEDRLETLRKLQTSVKKIRMWSHWCVTNLT